MNIMKYNTNEPLLQQYNTNETGVHEYTIHTKEDLQYLLKTVLDTSIIIYVGASWCNPCKKAFPIVETHFRNRQQRNAIFIKLDYDDDKSAVSFLKVRSVPSIFYFKNNSKENVCFSGSEQSIQTFFDEISI